MRKGSAPERTAHRLRALYVLLLAALCVAVGACRERASETPLVEAAALLPERDPLLEDLTSRDPELTRSALAEIRGRSDARYAAPLIELLRALGVGIVDGLDPRALIDVLEAVSGQDFGAKWSEWVRWYAKSELEPPLGFTGWKGQLLGRIDPNFARVLAYGMPSRIRVEEIVWGGVAFEGIPALDDPAILAAASASGLEDGDAVFGVAVGGDARAYPLRILDWHEMANDTVGATPISLAYCTLCGSGIAYDRRAPDGTTYDFGSSGLLMRSNKLMVDRQTQSLWNQFTGEPVVGPLVDTTDFRLRVVPSVVTTWGEWRRRHPETTVVSFETGFERSYEAGAAYADYFASDDTMFPVAADGSGRPAKERVIGIEIDGRARSFPLEQILASGVLNESVGSVPVVLIAASGSIEIEGTSRRSEATRRYSAGAEVRAYGRGETRFSIPEPALEPELRRDRVQSDDGRTWRVTEQALIGPDGERQERIPSILSYRFGWSSFHPAEAGAESSTEPGALRGAE